MKTYFVLSDNTDFDNDMQEVEKSKRKNCNRNDGFMLAKKTILAGYGEKTTKLYTINNVNELESIVKKSVVYDYTSIETIVRINGSLLTFNQYRDSLKTNKN